MKHLITAVALATLVASPAMAQSWNPSVGSGNTAPAPYGLTINGYNKAAGSNAYAGNAFAQAPHHRAMSRRSDPNFNEYQFQRQNFDF